MEFWEQKSSVIITHDIVPGDGIHRVISQKRDRVLFERFATQRQPLKVTLTSSWLVLQQQLTLKEGVNSISKAVASWESRAGSENETKNATAEEMATGIQKWTWVLKEQKVTTDALLKNEADTQENKRVTISFEQNLYSRRPSERLDDIQ